jgi:hypothetical protein
MEKTVLNERPLLGARIVSLNVRVWALADIRVLPAAGWR